MPVRSAPLMSLHTLANMGVFIKIAGPHVLIDALNTETAHSPFPAISGARGEAICAGNAPYERVDMLLITHGHPDHCDPAAVAAFAAHHPKALIVASPGVIDTIREKAPQHANLHALAPGWGEARTLAFQGLLISAVAVRHTHAHYHDIEHLAFVLHGTHDVVHVGDAGFLDEHFQQWTPHVRPDCTLIASFPYLTVPHAWERLRHHVRPRRVVACHLPDPNRDQGQWIRASREAVRNRGAEGPQLVLADAEGLNITLH